MNEPVPKKYLLIWISPLLSPNLENYICGLGVTWCVERRRYISNLSFCPVYVIFMLFISISAAYFSIIKLSWGVVLKWVSEGVTAIQHAHGRKGEDRYIRSFTLYLFFLKIQ